MTNDKKITGKSKIDRIKIKVIFFTDELKSKFVGTQYYSELEMMRKKYIYKDISKEELLRDIQWLKNVKDLLRFR